MSHRKVKDIFEKYNHEYFDQLIDNNVEFTYLVKRYSVLDREICGMDDNSSTHALRERLKKHRLQLKDEAYAILQEMKQEQLGEAKND